MQGYLGKGLDLWISIFRIYSQLEHHSFAAIHDFTIRTRLVINLTNRDDLSQGFML